MHEKSHDKLHDYILGWSKPYASKLSRPFEAIFLATDIWANVLGAQTLA